MEEKVLMIPWGWERETTAGLQLQNEDEAGMGVGYWISGTEEVWVCLQSTLCPGRGLDLILAFPSPSQRG